MDFRIVDMPEFQVAGKTLRVTTRDGENMRRIPKFWQDCLADGTYKRLAAIAAGRVLPAGATVGMCMDFDFAADTEEFTYMVAAELPPGTAPDVGLTRRTVPALTWSVFEAEGAMPEAIQTLWGRIWSEFFPAGEYEHGQGPDIELYPPGDATQSDFRFEVWVPVVRKSAL